MHPLQLTASLSLRLSSDRIIVNGKTTIMDFSLLRNYSEDDGAAHYALPVPLSQNSLVIPCMTPLTTSHDTVLDRMVCLTTIREAADRENPSMVTSPYILGNVMAMTPLGDDGSQYVHCAHILFLLRPNTRPVPLCVLNKTARLPVYSVRNYGQNVAVTSAGRVSVFDAETAAPCLVTTFRANAVAIRNNILMVMAKDGRIGVCDTRSGNGAAAFIRPKTTADRGTSSVVWSVLAWSTRNDTRVLLFDATTRDRVLTLDMRTTTTAECHTFPQKARHIVFDYLTDSVVCTP